MKKIYFLLFLPLVIGCKDTTKKESTDTLIVQHEEKHPELKESIARGTKVYKNLCATCHLSGGQGIPGVFPPLKNSNWLIEKRQKTIHTVKYGLSGPIEVNGEKYDNLMPQPGLSDQESADVLNYIFNSWGNAVKEPVSKEEVAAIEK